MEGILEVLRILLLVAGGYVLYTVAMTVLRPYLPTPLKAIPGPPRGHFFLGHFLDVATAPPLSAFLRWAKAKPEAPLLFYRFLWNEPRVLVTDPLVCRQVLVTDAKWYSKNVRGYNLLRLALGDGLITQEHQTHAAHRKLVAPAFRYAVLKRLVPKYALHADRMVAYMAEQHAAEIEVGAYLDVCSLLNKVTLDIIGDAGFGTQLDAFEDPGKGTLGQRLSFAFSRLITRHNVYNSFFPFLRYLPSPGNISAIRNAVVLDQTVLTVVREKRAKQAAGEGTYEDLLDILIAAKDDETGFQLSDKHLAAHIKTFLAAGHETTSTLLTWILFALSQLPEVEAKLLAEIEETVGDGPLDFDTLEKLSYMSRVVKEALRLYSPVGIIGRRAERDEMLGGYLVPKGTQVMISPYVLHHLPHLWEDVEKFDPDRWLKERMEGQQSCQYLPFIMGPRDCIGKKFATLEAKAILTRLLPAYRFSMDAVEHEEQQRRLHVTLRPHPTLRMRVTKR